MDCIFGLIEGIFKFLFGSHDGEIDRTGFWTAVAAFWTAVAALSAGMAVYVAWFELSRTRKSTHADFAKRFVDSFFTTESREFFALLMNSALEFEILEIRDKTGKKVDQLPIMKIKPDIANQLNGVICINPKKTGYSAFEIDDLLLGHLEDIAWYEKRKLMDMETIREMFGYYIYESYENDEIKKYLQHECNNGKYTHFKRLAEYIKTNPRE